MECFMTSLMRYALVVVILIGVCAAHAVADDPALAAPSKVLPVPGDEEQKRARAGIEQVFKDDVAAAKTAAPRSALAKKLVQVAIDPGTSPAESYVLLSMA